MVSVGSTPGGLAWLEGARQTDRTTEREQRQAEGVRALARQTPILH